MKKLNPKLIFAISLFLILIFLSFSNQVYCAIPYGANVSFVNSSTAKPNEPLSAQAQAGNVTEINIFGYSTTRTWQGYFGNVSGTIQLAGSNNNVFYNWSVASPKGQIYASMNDSLNWQNIQCFNFSATGTYADDSSNRGGTSKFGMNITQLESMFNIDPDDVDGVDETFKLNTTGPGHKKFYTNNLEFSQGECASASLFDNTGSGQNNIFEQVLLYDPDTRTVVFTSLLTQNALGFDNKPRDFQMIVLEDGHGANTETTTYYFYVELY